MQMESIVRGYHILKVDWDLLEKHLIWRSMNSMSKTYVQLLLELMIKLWVTFQ